MATIIIILIKFNLNLIINNYLNDSIAILSCMTIRVYPPGSIMVDFTA